MFAGDTLFCLQSAVKFSKAFGLCNFNRESVRVRGLVQNFELHYLAMMLEGCEIAGAPLKFVQNTKTSCPCPPQ